MWRRGVAFLIDLVPLGILAAIENGLGIADSRAIGLFNLAAVLWYDAGMNYWYGGTIGKRMTGLRVALPRSPQVGPQLVIRTVIRISCLFPPAGTLYALIAIWRSDGQSLADFATGTTVVDALTQNPPQRPSTIGRITASVLAVVVPWLLLLTLIIFLFGVLIIEELIRTLQV